MVGCAHIFHYHCKWSNSEGHDCKIIGVSLPGSHNTITVPVNPSLNHCRIKSNPFLITFCHPKYEWIIINQFSDVSDDKHYVFDILSVEVRLSVINSFVKWIFRSPSENTRSVYQNNLVSPACETGFLAIQRLQIGNNVITNLTSFQPYHEKVSNAVNTR